MLTINLPEVLQEFVDGKSQITVNATNLDTISHEIETKHQALFDIMYDENYELSGYLNYFLANELLDEESKIPEDATLDILVSVSGG